jgi:hypothetical protein
MNTIINQYQVKELAKKFAEDNQEFVQEMAHEDIMGAV